MMIINGHNPINPTNKSAIHFAPNLKASAVLTKKEGVPSEGLYPLMGW